MRTRPVARTAVIRRPGGVRLRSVPRSGFTASRGPTLQAAPRAALRRYFPHPDQWRTFGSRAIWGRGVQQVSIYTDEPGIGYRVNTSGMSPPLERFPTRTRGEREGPIGPDAARPLPEEWFRVYEYAQAHPSVVRAYRHSGGASAVAEYLPERPSNPSALAVGAFPFVAVGAVLVIAWAMADSPKAR